MSGGRKPDPRRRSSTSKQALAALAVVFLLGATATSTVGVALGDVSGSNDGRVPAGERAAPYPMNDTDNETNDSERGDVPDDPDHDPVRRRAGSVPVPPRDDERADDHRTGDYRTEPR
ncbi:hypothetical protein [Halorussus caseinilyticus]|uniref:Uncharacterized protein n=1 Tax=Halorussus caseinilyticus TaxID=3034025 RepID=A0ABD5WP56_9EURY